MGESTTIIYEYAWETTRDETFTRNQCELWKDVQCRRLDFFCLPLQCWLISCFFVICEAVSL